MTIDYKDAKAVLEVCEAATKGPWIHLYPLADWEANKPGGTQRQVVTIEAPEDSEWGPDILEDISEENARFISISREALPYFVQRTVELEAEAERLRAENEALKTTGAFIALQHVLSNPNCTVFGSEEWAELQIAHGILFDALAGLEG